MRATDIGREQFPRRLNISRWLHWRVRSSPDIGAEQNEHAAEYIIMQRHGKDRQEADTQTGKPAPLPVIERGEPGAPEHDRDSGRNKWLHDRRQREQKRAEKGRREIVARTVTNSAEQRQQRGDEQNIGGRIGEAARGPFGVVDKTRPEQGADRHRYEQQDQRQRPAIRQETAEQAKHQKRQQKNEREITKIAFAEHDMFERAKIAQARAPVVKDFFAAFERAPDIPGQKFLQNDAANTVVEQPIVAAVHGPHPAEEAGVVDRDHQERQDDQNGRQDNMPSSEPN